MRVLLVTTRAPFPAWRGNQLRTVQMAGWLADRHEVTVLSPASPGQRAGGDDSAVRRETFAWRSWERAAGLALAAWRGEPLQNGLYRSSALRRRLRDVVRSREFDVVILQLVRLEHASRIFPSGSGVSLVVDLVDALSLNAERRALYDRRRLRPAWRAEAARLVRAEQRMVERSASAWVVCDRDRRHLAQAFAAAAPPGSELAERLTVVPLAVPAPAPPAEIAKSRPTVVLTGNLGYFPTEEGASWFLAEVWPRVRARRPEMELILAGSRPAAALRRQVERAPGAKLVADPGDLGAVLASGAIAIAPMRAGSGVPIKILEAWRAGVPVVATSWAAAGVDATDTNDLLIADEPDAWVVAIERLLDDRETASRLVESGRRRLAADYSEQVARARCEAALDALPTPRAK